MNRLRKPALMYALLGMAAAWGFTLGAVAPTHAQTWSEYAMVSATMGVSDGRVCVGEGSRGDIGCPTYAPYVDAATGFVGIGTSSGLTLPLTVSRESASSAIGVNGNSGQFKFLSLMTDSKARWHVGTSNLTEAGSNIGTDFYISRFADDGAYIERAFVIRRDTGNTAVGFIITPTTKLHVAGSVRLGYETSSTLNTCDTSRTGAIKYQSGDFYYCRNGTAWESLTSLSGGGGTAGDRITSGTTGVYTYSNTSASIATAGVERVVVGTTGNVGIGQQPVSGIALSVSQSILGKNIYLTSSVQTSTTDSALTISGTNAATASLRIIRTSTIPGPIVYLTKRRPGATGQSLANDYLGGLLSAAYDDTGTLREVGTIGFSASENLTSTSYPADFYINLVAPNTTTPQEVFRITASGNVGIGTNSPTAKLDVSGTVSATLVKLANDPADACTAATIGAIKSINGRIYVCRQ